MSVSISDRLDWLDAQLSDEYIPSFTRASSMEQLRKLSNNSHKLSAINFNDNVDDHIPNSTDDIHINLLASPLTSPSHRRNHTRQLTASWSAGQTNKLKLPLMNYISSYHAQSKQRSASVFVRRASSNSITSPLYMAPQVNHTTAMVVNYLAVSNTLTLLLNDRRRQQSTIIHHNDTNVRDSIANNKNNVLLRQSYVTESDVLNDVHTVPLEVLLDRYNSNIVTGLSDADAKDRLILHGYNIMTPPKSQSIALMFIKQLYGGFNWVLWLAVVLSVISYKPLGGDHGEILNVALAGVLVIVIITSAIFNFYQEYSANNILKGFQNLVPPIANVLRDGEYSDIQAAELQIGDIVKVSLGSKCPADLRLIHVDGLRLDISMLTGESEPIVCTTKCTSKSVMSSRNISYYGAHVVEGTGIGIVVAIGDNTILGKISTLTNNAVHMTTSMQTEINHFVTTVKVAALITSACIVILWAVYIRTHYSAFMSVSGILINVIAMVVGFVPEGLPISVTVTLGLTAKQMSRHNVLVKDLAVIETFNTISLICSDKTGTLTQNKMTVSHLVVGLSEASRIDCNNKLHQLPDKVRHPVYSRLLMCATLCNNAEPSFDEVASALVLKGDASDTAMYDYCNRYVDVMIVRNAHKRRAVLPFNSTNKYMISIHNVDFNLLQPSYKGASGKTRKKVLFLKGAPEIVLQRCNRCIDDSTGEWIELTNDRRIQWNMRQGELGQKGERVLGFSMCELDPAIYTDDYIYNMHDISDANPPNFPVNNLVFIGLASLIDPPKAEVPDALAACKKAQIRVCMVTGDHPSTASAIAKQIGLITYKNIDTLDIDTDANNNTTIACISNGVQVGIRKVDQYNSDTDNTTNKYVFQSVETYHRNSSIFLPNDHSNQNTVNSSNNIDSDASNQSVLIDIDTAHLSCASHTDRLYRALVVTGEQIELFDSIIWDWVLRHDEIVFARTTPEQKLRIVMEAQCRGDSVAVTGDGVNDAPALRAANLGIAMQNGSEIAREAGDMILMDNNFNSIVHGIELGRLVYDNLKKVCIYLLPAGSFCEMITVLANVCLGIQPALSPFYMITISMFTDVFMSTAMIYEQAENDIMSRAPRKLFGQRLVDLKLLLYSYVIGIIQSIGAWTIFFWYMNDGNIPINKLLFAYDKWPSGQFESDGVTETTYIGLTYTQLNERLYSAQALFFASLVICQFGNALSIRTRRNSILQQNPLWGKNRNVRILINVIISFVTIMIVCYTPWLQQTFNTRVPELRYAFGAVGFAAALVVFDETRKYIVRNYPHSVVARYAW